MPLTPALYFPAISSVHSQSHLSPLMLYHPDAIDVVVGRQLPSLARVCSDRDLDCGYLSQLSMELCFHQGESLVF